jgi:hypothetical protein
MNKVNISKLGLKQKKFVIIPGLALLLIGVLISGCSTDEASAAYQLAPLSEMHPLVQKAPVTVQNAYRFANANPDILKHVPCYCGCGGMGHTSNYACFVNESNGEMEVDGHALGCSICVDIALDAMRVLDDGQSLSAIQEYVDTKYSAFGPSNMP